MSIWWKITATATTAIFRFVPMMPPAFRRGTVSKGFYDFHPNVPQDPNVPDDAFSFGRDLAPVNGAGGYCGAGLISAGDWMTKALDIQGFRLDYVKGFRPTGCARF